MQSFYIGSYRTKVDIPAPNANPVAVGDLNDDTLFVCILDVLVFVRAVYIKANLLDEGCGHDEKDQHDEHDIQHRCQINLALFLCLLAEYSSHNKLLK